MNCKQFRECLDNYESLTADEKLEMTAHTEECEACRQELDFMLSIIETTKSLPRIKPPSDFLDKLNVRIDMEEKKRQQLAKRIIRNMQKNWKQYAAAAACFVLVAVVTSNGKMLVDKMNHSDDGVIQEQTAASDDSGSAAPASTAVPQTVETDSKADLSSAFEETAFPPTAKATAGNTVSANTPDKGTTASPSKGNASVKVSANKPASQIADSGVQAPSSNVSEEKTEDTKQVMQQSSRQQNTESQDYDIAIARMMPDDGISAYGLEGETADYTEDNARNGYSLADRSDNIALSRYYNSENDEDDTEDEPKAIGKLKISSADADRAMNVIQQYSYNSDGDLYTTDPASLALMLSSLNREDVSYTNYTMESDGVIKFKIDFN